MFASIRRMVGAVHVVENQGIITVSGLPANTIGDDIRRVWETTRITSNMFTHIGHSDLSIPSFYAIDLEYILRQLLEDKRARTNRRALRAVLAELHTNTWLRNLTDESIPQALDFSRLNMLNLTLMEHQRLGLEHYSYNKLRYGLNGYLLDVGAGGGKTIFCMAISLCAKADVTFIVCPKNAIHKVWRNEIQTRLKQEAQFWVANDGGPVPPKAKYLIFHFEALEKALAMAQHYSGKRVTVILDESHNLNEVDSKRTMLFLDLCKRTKATDVIWSSGTPIKAMGSEAIPLIRSIDPMFTPDAEARFRKIYGTDAKKAYNILKHRMGIISYKVPKSKFMTDKPVYERIDVKIPNGDRYTLDSIRIVMKKFVEERTVYYASNRKKYRAFYDDCINQFQKTLHTKEQRQAFNTYQSHINLFVKKGFDAYTMKEQARYCNDYEKNTIMPALPQAQRAGFRDAKSVVKYVELKIRGECLGRILSKEREQCHVEMCAHIDFGNLIDNAEKKTLVFTDFVKAVDASYEACRHAGFKPLRVYGDTNSDLTNMVTSFANDADVNPIIATYKSLSAAVPLTMSNNLIMINSPFRYHDQEQAVARAWRIGQDTTVYVWRCFLDTGELPNISTRSEDILSWSKEQVDNIIGLDVGSKIDVSMEAHVTLEAHDPEDCAYDEECYEAIATPVVNRSLSW